MRLEGRYGVSDCCKKSSFLSFPLPLPLVGQRPLLTVLYFYCTCIITTFCRRGGYREKLFNMIIIIWYNIHLLTDAIIKTYIPSRI